MAEPTRGLLDTSVVIDHDVIDPALRDLHYGRACVHSWIENPAHNNEDLHYQRWWLMQMRNTGQLWLAGTITVFFALSACSQNEQPSETLPKKPLPRDAQDIAPIAGASAARLSEAELEQSSAASLNGDALAAMRVHMHYQMVVLDKKKGAFWAQIAAENGSIDGMVEYSDYLLGIIDSNNCRRARFWATRALGLAQSDDERAAARALDRSVDQRCKASDVESAE